MPEVYLFITFMSTFQGQSPRYLISGFAARKTRYCIESQSATQMEYWPPTPILELEANTPGISDAATYAVENTTPPTNVGGVVSRFFALRFAPAP